MSAGTSVVPRHALLACEPLSARLDAHGVAAAIAEGLRAGGAPQPDLVALAAGASDRETAELLEREHFHRRMLGARAVVVAVPALTERTLAGSSAFELATRARQSGVPCYAVASSVELNAFDLRILDLQIVLRARCARTLHKAGERLAELV